MEQNQIEAEAEVTNKENKSDALTGVFREV